MTKLTMSVNGRAVTLDVNPRRNLADVLREDLSLTGTHLGCEHGACGACTVLMNDVPVRSCVAMALTCERASIRTIESYDDDPVMTSLRKLFHEEHALQCGYCTAGMLATARDIVLRYDTADIAAIRRELAGCICRCTGYRGIVRAIVRCIENKPVAANDGWKTKERE